MNVLHCVHDVQQNMTRDRKAGAGVDDSHVV